MLYVLGWVLALALILWLVGGLSGLLIAITAKEEPWTWRQWRSAFVMAFLWPILIVLGAFLRK